MTKCKQSLTFRYMEKTHHQLIELKQKKMLNEGLQAKYQDVISSYETRVAKLKKMLCDIKAECAAYDRLLEKERNILEEQNRANTE